MQLDIPLSISPLDQASMDVGLASQVGPYLIASHRSQKHGHHLILDWLERDPLPDLDLRLGEGNGAGLGIWLAEAACKLLNEMATFGQAGISEKRATARKAGQ